PEGRGFESRPRYSEGPATAGLSRSRGRPLATVEVPPRSTRTLNARKPGVLAELAEEPDELVRPFSDFLVTAELEFRLLHEPGRPLYEFVEIAPRHPVAIEPRKDLLALLDDRCDGWRGGVW